MACYFDLLEERHSKRSRKLNPVVVWQLTEVTKEAGLSGFTHTTGAAGGYWLPETMGGGVGVLDYDQDGWPDLALVRGGHWTNNTLPALALYRNSGDGSFVDVTEDTGLAETPGYGMGVAVGDYDNDGDPDLFLTTVGTDHLYRNDDGRFVETARAAGLAELAEWSTSALWLDADLDGWLDLYVGNYIEWSPEIDKFCSTDGQAKQYCTPELYEGAPGRFYHNQGNAGPGTGPSFADWTDEAGFNTSPGKTLGATTLDVNHDGWPDLVLANDTPRDELYLNRGDAGPGTGPSFTERGILSGMAYDEHGRTRAGMGIDAGVVNPSGEPWVFVGNFAREMIGVYQHVGEGRFADRAVLSKIGRPSLLTLTFGLMLFDADLDGDLDLITANGHIVEQVDQQQDGITYRQPPHLFLNDGTGRFADAAQAMPALQNPLVGRGAATLDYDRDGDVDVILTENGGAVHLYENTASDIGKNSLTVTVSGTTSNRSGYGTELIAVTKGTRQYRTIRSGSSYLSHAEATAVFGLGDAVQVDTLIVRWPSGTRDTLQALLANTVLHLTEGDAPQVIQ